MSVPGEPDDIRWAHDAYLLAMSGWPMHDAMGVDPAHETAIRAVIAATRERVAAEVATEWGVRYEDGWTSRVKDRENAEYIAAGDDTVVRTLVSRQVTPWQEVTP